MKVWVNSKGEVKSHGSGSIGKQREEMTLIIAYLLKQTSAAEKIMDDAKSRASGTKKGDKANG